MNEQEWLTSSNPAVMLDYATGGNKHEHMGGWILALSDRKLRLFACACLRYSWQGLTAPGSRESVVLAERIADELEVHVVPLVNDPTSLDHIGCCAPNVMDAVYYPKTLFFLRRIFVCGLAFLSILTFCRFFVCVIGGRGVEYRCGVENE